MDLRLYFRVISRFKYLVVGGLVLACVLTFFSIYSVSFANGLTVKQRQSQTYVSEQRLFLNTIGGVQYRTTTGTLDPKTGQVVYPPNLIPPSSLGNTSVLYSQLVNSDIVQRLVGHLPGSYFAYTPTFGATQAPQPFLAIDGYASTGAKAIAIARRVSNAFTRFVASSQAQNRVPTSQRVLLTVSTLATSASIKSGRHYTLPIIIFLVTLIATLGLAFILENVRPAAAATGGVESDSAAQPVLRAEPRLAEAVPVADEGAVDDAEAKEDVPTVARTEARRASVGHEKTRV